MKIGKENKCIVAIDELKGLPAVQVERIEILPTAGVGYRSSESAGAVIKITLKKIAEGGFYGSASGNLKVDAKRWLGDDATFLFN
jgi:outer membrane receptor for ferrienterochelin and colicin